MIPFPPPPASSLRIEYGDLQCSIEIVDDINDAIEHINKFSSNHTDSIVTENRIYIYFYPKRKKKIFISTF